MKTLCIHQPDFAPWLGFFDRLIDADIYVVFDDAQFLRRGWHHRDRILGPQGMQWLTVPVLKKGRYEQEIREVEIDESSDWRRKHLRTLATVYGKRPGFAGTHEALTAIYQRGHKKLIDLNMDIISWLLSEFDIDIEVRYASELGLTTRSTERLVDICRAFGAQNYITGTGARDYLDTSAFARHDITVEWQDFQHPVWNQGQAPFLSGLSALDALYHGASPIKMMSREEAG